MTSEEERAAGRERYEAELHGLLAWDRPQSPLRLAVVDGDLEAVRDLLAAGADPADTSDSYGARPVLSVAVESGRVEVIESLLQAGADPNQLDGRGQSSVHWAAAEACWACRGALNAASAGGPRAPLEPDWSIVWLLERYGGRRDLPDDDRSAEQVARSFGFELLRPGERVGPTPMTAPSVGPRDLPPVMVDSWLGPLWTSGGGVIGDLTNDQWPTSTLTAAGVELPLEVYISNEVEPVPGKGLTALPITPEVVASAARAIDDVLAQLVELRATIISYATRRVVPALNVDPRIPLVSVSATRSRGGFSTTLIFQDHDLRVFGALDEHGQVIGSGHDRLAKGDTGGGRLSFGSPPES